MRAFVFLAKFDDLFIYYLIDFIITKYLEQKADDDFSICMYECRLFCLSVTEDIKIYQCHMIKR